MKLCKDCKHVDIRKYPTDTIYFCNSPKRKSFIDKTSGEKRYNYNSCVALRTGGFFLPRFLGACGKSGRFFEPK